MNIGPQLLELPGPFKGPMQVKSPKSLSFTVNLPLSRLLSYQLQQDEETKAQRC